MLLKGGIIAGTYLILKGAFVLINNSEVALSVPLTTQRIAFACATAILQARLF